jgi:UDP-glucose 4-epimerase
MTKYESNQYRGKKIIVTGGAGFVGSWLSEALHDRGAEVISIDNYFTGSEKNHVAGVTYVRAETKEINTLGLSENVDYFFHLGEYSRVEQSFDDIDKVFEYNTESIYQVLKFVKAAGCKIIYSGSSTRFGDQGASSGESPYAWSKKTNADLVARYSSWFDLDYAITYFYNVYGPREISCGKYATLIASFMDKSINSNPLTVVKPGSQKRNFTHVSDIVDALMMIGLLGHGDDYGIASDEEHSVISVAEMFDCPVEFLPERRGNRLTSAVVSQKTKDLGWAAKVSLADYISRFRADVE